MILRYISPAGVERGDAEDLVAFRARHDGFLWIDFPECDDRAAAILSDEFGFRPQSIAACRQRSHLPIYQRFRNHWFVVLHRPLVGRPGHVHLLQLEQFIAQDALVTLHGPYNPEIDPVEVDRDTIALRAKLDNGFLSPKSPSELSYELVVGSRLQRIGWRHRSSCR